MNPVKLTSQDKAVGHNWLECAPNLTKYDFAIVP